MPLIPMTRHLQSVIAKGSVWPWNMLVLMIQPNPSTRPLKSCSGSPANGCAVLWSAGMTRNPRNKYKRQSNMPSDFSISRRGHHERCAWIFPLMDSLSILWIGGVAAMTWWTFPAPGDWDVRKIDRGSSGPHQAQYAPQCCRRSNRMRHGDVFPSPALNESRHRGLARLG